MLDAVEVERLQEQLARTRESERLLAARVVELLTGADRAMVREGDGGVVIGISGGEFCELVAQMMAQTMEETGAVNCLQWSVRHDTLGSFALTLQRCEGKTPMELRAEALAENEQARAVIESLYLALRALNDHHTNEHHAGSLDELDERVAEGLLAYREWKEGAGE